MKFILNNIEIKVKAKNIKKDKKSQKYFHKMITTKISLKNSGKKYFYSTFYNLYTHDELSILFT